MTDSTVRDLWTQDEEHHQHDCVPEPPELIDADWELGWE